MTDKEKLIKVFTDCGIGVEDRGTIVICGENQKGVRGYTGFYTKFEFDDDGSFKEMGAYE